MSLRKLSLILLLGGLLLSMGAAAAPAQDTVRIGYLQADIHQLACWVALEKGFYKEQGLKVEVAGIFRAGPEEMSAFAAGALDMGYVGEAPATVAVANRAAKVTVVAQVNTEGSAIVVHKNSPLNKVAGLKGRTVAVPGHSTVQDFLLKKAISQAGLPLNQVKTMVLKPPEMIGALRGKQIDGFVAWEPYPAKAVTMGVGRVLISSAKIWPQHPCCVLVADNAFLAAHPKRVARMVAAHVKATDFINKHPAEALKIGMRYTGMDRQTVKLAMANVNYTYRLSLAGEKEYVQFLDKLGYIKVPDADAFVSRFIDAGILKKATAR
ncbi:MAG: ABC transporter substrate-binding protein [Desulfarculaceae bacterium]|nr:ABC transporter substrate-binding protein [Desulfarculaceae bacterium]MCF8072683.1 ABC transporter substrate-binding protein [Desulfarculaceae bacterium]MCF8102562.1 ABC transporter substrate-binding protein [Desulfarculaceae bacterium]MCF8116471.1 ABC transporter substrate-binding protein [Desulfarculaceae bacterium]